MPSRPPSRPRNPPAHRPAGRRMHRVVAGDDPAVGSPRGQGGMHRLSPEWRASLLRADLAPRTS
jgi:hypothetical protein